MEIVVVLGLPKIRCRRASQSPGEFIMYWLMDTEAGTDTHPTDQGATLAELVAQSLPWPQAAAL